MNQMPDEIDRVEMLNCYGAYWSGMKPLAKSIGKDKNGFYLVGMFVGLDEQVWLNFKSGDRYVYRKISPSEKNEKKFKNFSF